jgi:predicted kinase
MTQMPFKLKPDKQMIVFIGIQASGKTTFYRSFLAEAGYVHINLDTLRTRNKEKLAIQACFRDGRSFVVDNTNPEKADRARYIPDAREHGYEVIGIFFQSILKECISHNEMREKKVPPIAIPAVQNRLQMPEYAEGFDQLYFVRIEKDDFLITEWRE